MAQTRNDVGFNRIPPQFKQKWKIVRDVCTGDDAIREDESYLPYLNKFDLTQGNVARNAAYRTRAVWYPATKFTLDGFLGLAFRVDPTNNIEGTKLEPLLKDADGAGVSLYQQSQDALANNMQVGRHGLYVDYSNALKRPIIKPYRAESIINWRYENRDGQMVLTLIVLEEEVEEPDGDWAIRTVKQWREIFLDAADGYCYVRLWKEKVGPEGAPVTVNGQSELMVSALKDANGDTVDMIQLRSQRGPLTFLPFTFIGARSNDGAIIDQPPLYGLAQLNVAHFRNSADYEDSVFFCGQVQPWISGLDTEWRDHLENPTVEVTLTDGSVIRQPTGQRLYVGSRTPMLLPTGGAFDYAQAQPNTLVKEAMDQKEAQMVAVGARMIEATPGTAQTATEDENDREATTSVLSMCVANVNEGYQRAIWMCGQFLDLGEKFDTSDSYKINQDFVKTTADATLLSEMVKSWQTGVSAKNDVREYMRRVGLIPVERSDADIDADLENEGPRLGTLGVDPATGLPTADNANPPRTGNARQIPNSGGGGTGGGNPGAPGGNDPSGGPSGGNQGGGDPQGGTVIPIRRPSATGSQNDITDVVARPAPPPRSDGASPATAPAASPAAPSASPSAPVPAPVAAPPAPDLQPLFDALQLMMQTMQETIRAMQQFRVPPTDFAPLVDAIQRIAPPTITVQSPNITVTPPSVTVEAPNVQLPSMTMNVDSTRASGKKVGRLVKTANGYDIEVQTINEGN